MTSSELCLISSGVFLLSGLTSGVWKYVSIARSPRATAPVYVDIAHRAALLYAFACALLAQLTERSAWPDGLNLASAAIAIFYFLLALAGYLVHGYLRDTDNQLARPHRLGRFTIPSSVMVAFMLSLILGEVGGVGVIFSGYLVKVVQAR